MGKEPCGVSSIAIKRQDLLFEKTGSLLVKNTFRVLIEVINWHDVLFEKMWAVAEWPGERRLAAMAAAAEKLKHGICC